MTCSICGGLKKLKYRRLHGAVLCKLCVKTMPYHIPTVAEIQECGKLSKQQSKMLRNLIIWCRTSDHRKHRPNNITPKDIIKLLHKQHHRCAITGLKLMWDTSHPNCVSIDRKKSQDLGHTVDNIQLVCRWVNLAKSTYSNQLFKDLIADVAVEQIRQLNIWSKTHIWKQPSHIKNLIKIAKAVRDLRAGL